jgi:O-antigen/teichoic acid export membrane protein
MLVTAAAYPLAVKRAVMQSRAAALWQLSQAGALLAGVTLPVAVGLLIVNRGAVNLMIGPEFRSLTIAVLPIAVLSGAVRNLRTHFADQAFLLCERSDMSLLIAAIEAVLTVPACIAGLLWGGLVGACLGCLVAHVVAALLTFGLAVRRFALPMPWGHLARIATATATMAAALLAMSWRSTPLGLALEIAVGVAIYGGVILAFYRRDIRALAATRAGRPARSAAE